MRPVPESSRYSVSTLRAPWDMACTSAIRTLTSGQKELVGVVLYPIKRGCWADAEWLVCATFRRDKGEQKHG